MNAKKKGTVNGAWMPTVVFDEEVGVLREKLIQAFSAENIDARVLFYPLSSLSMFDACSENRIAWGVPKRGINLPSYHELTQADQERVIGVISSLMKKLTP